MPAGERCRRAVCGRTACTVRCGGGRHPGPVGKAVPSPDASRQPYIARISPTIGRPPSSERPVLATRLDVASTRAVAAPPAVALPVSDKSGSRERRLRAVAARAEEPLADRRPCRPASAQNCRSCGLSVGLFLASDGSQKYALIVAGERPRRAAIWAIERPSAPRTWRARATGRRRSSTTVTRRGSVARHAL